MANELYSKELIAKDTQDKAQIASVDGYNRATTLLSAVQVTLSSGGDDRNLKKLWKIMSEVQTMKELSAKMKDKYGK